MTAPDAQEAPLEAMTAPGAKDSPQEAMTAPDAKEAAGGRRRRVDSLQTCLSTPPKRSRKSPQTEKAAKCEDPHHASAAHLDIRKSREDGVVRCSDCRLKRKRSATVVGNRGLGLKAYFRNRLTSVAVAPNASPEAIDVETQELSSAKAKPLPAAQEAGAHDAAITPAAASEGPDESRHKGKAGSDDVDWDLSMEQDDFGGLALASSKLGDVDLWLGCEACERWYLVDELIYSHWTNWKEIPFTCAAIGETCDPEEEPASTALVSCDCSDDLRSRAGSLNSSLPHGCWDVYRSGSALEAHQPTSAVEGHPDVAVFAAPLGMTTEATRVLAEEALHKAFTNGAAECITRLVGLREPSVGSLRSGARLSRAEPVGAVQRWLIWETVAGGRVVGAAVMVRQRNTLAGPSRLQGGPVLEYIAADRAAGGRGHPLVLAAEEICRMMGFPELFSACDLAQQGQAFGGSATPALAAHQRWGFRDMDREEWTERRFFQYNRKCRVHFMVKTLRP